MRNLRLCALLVLGLGCNSILGIDDHELAGNARGSASGGIKAIGGSTSFGGTNVKAGGSSMGGSTLPVGWTQAIGGTSNAGGNKASGGTVNLGGASGATGGVNAVGGMSAIGGAGGVSSSSGAKSTGGSPSTGGTRSNGGATAVSAGGTAATGETTFTGGSKAAGGTTSIGGTASTGGTKATGGTMGATITGGAVSTGGAVTGGAAPGTGGIVSTSGSATGGVATGGTATGGVATGGAVSTGGTTTTGGSTSSCVPTGTEVCDGVDNNCNSFIDEGCVCPGTGGPAMVRLPQGYCIDSTEVTRDQYAAWLSTTTAATLNAQDVTNCSWNASFTPDSNCMAGFYVCQGTTCGNHPQVCVNWCDATAYCEGVGKRLCGAKGGGPNQFNDVANATTSQWFAACTSGGSSACSYPYCLTYGTKTCNGYDYWAPTDNVATLPVGTLKGCQSPDVRYAGVFDLSGNVYEWEDSCVGTTGPLDGCRLRGGSFYDASYYQACSFANSFSRKGADFFVGFRCCSP